MWSMYDTVESTVQFCLQKPNVHNSTLLKNTYEVSLIQGGLVTSAKIIFLDMFQRKNLYINNNDLSIWFKYWLQNDSFNL